MVETMTLDTDVEVEETEEKFRERLGKAKKIIDNGFAPLGPGEKIGSRELNRKFSALSKVWYVKPYSKMSVVEKRTYYRQLAQQIRAANVRSSHFDR